MFFIIQRRQPGCCESEIFARGVGNVCPEAAVRDAYVLGRRGRPKDALHGRLSSSRRRSVSLVRYSVYVSGRYSVGRDITFGAIRVYVPLRSVPCGSFRILADPCASLRIHAHPCASLRIRAHHCGSLRIIAGPCASLRILAHHFGLTG